VYPVHPNPNVRRPVAEILSDHPRIHLVDPVGYRAFVQLLRRAWLVVTDSGGIQEETTALGVPCLTLRANTERPITVTLGTNRLVGGDAAAVASAWKEIQSGCWPQGRLPELWDGKAAQRIVDVLLNRVVA